MTQRLIKFSEMLRAAVISLISSRRGHEGRGRIKQPGYRLNFTEVNDEGAYRIEAEKIVSTDFRIADDAYAGTAGFLLTYYPTNECTIDRTACLIYDLSALRNVNPAEK